MKDQDFLAGYMNSTGPLKEEQDTLGRVQVLLRGEGHFRKITDPLRRSRALQE